MTIRSAVMFMPSGKGSPMFFAQWRTKGPLKPVQAGAILVDGGIATHAFRSVWAAAFPIRPPLPAEKLANDDGTGTDAFWKVFT